MVTTAALNPVDDPMKAMRTAMVAELREIGAITAEPVAAAFTAVPRHLFAPDTTPELAYNAIEAVLAKRNAEGVATSWVSAPSVQAQMLEQLGVEPGMRVLEVGSGGYNAALIAELVGAGGHVVSVDIDPDIAARARSFLAEAGYADRVQVVVADAEYPLPEQAPFDRIIVTAGAWDLPPSWAEQLAVGGRLLVPLRMRGLTRTVAFEKDGDRLASRSYRLAAFVPMQGEGSHDKRLITVDPAGVAVWVDEAHQFVDAEALRTALHTDPVRVWTGIGFDLPDESELYIGTNAPAVAILHAGQEVVDSGLLAPTALRGVPALLSEDCASFAYRTKRVVNGSQEAEFGTIGHGPDGRALAEQLARMLSEWSQHFRYRDAATITVYPRSTPDGDLPAGCVMTKHHSRVVVSWHKPRAS
jgi:protein-L-isoaspartate(D-aspartate) O-methyltransferase